MIVLDIQNYHIPLIEIIIKTYFFEFKSGIYLI